MITLEDLPPLRAPVVVAAFEGWNDAGQAASGLLSHLAETWGARPIASTDPEDYYDLQVNRPRVAVRGSSRDITWPTTSILLVQNPDLPRDLLLIDGIEPSMRWRSFCTEILDLTDEADAELLVCMGALLAEVPHTRPLPVMLTSENAAIRERYDAERSTYEGPTGIVGVLAESATRRDLPAVSAWVSVPHYAAGVFSPKATLAMIGIVERLIGCPIPRGDLADRARTWERGVDELADSDREIGEYVRALEETTDAAESPDASGDAIAREFERYLRGHGDDRP